MKAGGGRTLEREREREEEGSPCQFKLSTSRVHRIGVIGGHTVQDGWHATTDGVTDSIGHVPPSLIASVQTK
jgi:hypothetical protein